MLHLRAHTIRKAIFIILCCTAAGCLLASFSRPLESLEVWKQPNPKPQGMSREEIFIFTESQTQYPERLNRSRATQVTYVHHHFRLEKLSALLASLLASSGAVVLGHTLPESGADDSTQSNPNRNPPSNGGGSQSHEVLLSKMRGRWQQMNEHQKALFRKQIRTLAKLVEDTPASSVSEQELSEQVQRETATDMDADYWFMSARAETPAPARSEAKREKCVAK